MDRTRPAHTARPAADEYVRQVGLLQGRKMRSRARTGDIAGFGPEQGALPDSMIELSPPAVAVGDHDWLDATGWGRQGETE